MRRAGGLIAALALAAAALLIAAGVAVAVAWFLEPFLGTD